MTAVEVPMAKPSRRPSKDGSSISVPIRIGVDDWEVLRAVAARERLRPSTLARRILGQYVDMVREEEVPASE